MILHGQLGAVSLLEGGRLGPVLVFHIWDRVHVFSKSLEATMQRAAAIGPALMFGSLGVSADSIRLKGRQTISRQEGFFTVSNAIRDIQRDVEWADDLFLLAVIPFGHREINCPERHLPGAVLETLVPETVWMLAFQFLAGLVLEGIENGGKKGYGGKALETMKSKTNALEGVSVFWYAHLKDKVNL